MSHVKLFYAPGACSLAPHIVLEEIGAPFTPVLVDTKSGAHKRPDYLAINPKARVPAIAVGDWTLTENPAILQYLARRSPAAQLWPDALEEQAKCQEWLAWIASTVHVAYAHVRRVERYADSAAAQADVVAKGLSSSRDVWGDIEHHMRDRTWVLGDRYSVADAYALVFWTWGRGPVLGFDMDRQFPHWTAQARRMGARPAVQRAFAREGLALP